MGTDRLAPARERDRERENRLVASGFDGVVVRVAGGSVPMPTRPAGFVIVDARRHEITWLNAVLGFMVSDGYSLRTVATYGEGFVRMARCAWALGYSMDSLGPIEYAITRALLVAVGDLKTGDPYANSTLRISEAALTTIYDVAKRYKRLDIDNPVRALLGGIATGRIGGEDVGGVHRLKPHGGRNGAIAPRSRRFMPVLTDPQSADLLAASAVREKALVQLLLDSGARISEVLSITPSSLHPESESIVVRAKSEGAASDRPIYASPDAFEKIGEYRDALMNLGLVIGEHDPIFRMARNPEAPLERVAAYHAIQKVAPGVNPHMIRRTVANDLLDTLDGDPGANLFDVMDFLGHSRVASLQPYIARRMGPRLGRWAKALARTPSEDHVEPASVYGFDTRERITWYRRHSDG